jgi:hypothetical protein
MITPVVSFSHHHFIEWLALTFKEMAAEAEKVRLALKVAIDYPWDNPQFVLEDSTGKPALTLLFDASSPAGTLTCWSVRTGCMIGTFTEDARKADPKEFVCKIEDWANRASDGQARCAECGHWVIAFKKFDFTGSVCMDCYSPKKHHAPHTSGD